MSAYLESVMVSFSISNCALFCRLLILFQNQLFFQKISSGISPGCRAVWIQIRYNVLSGLKWIQTVCRGYQETRLVSRFVVNHQMTVVMDVTLDPKFLSLKRT